MSGLAVALQKENRILQPRALPPFLTLERSSSKSRLRQRNQPTHCLVLFSPILPPPLVQFLHSSPQNLLSPHLSVVPFPIHLPLLLLKPLNCPIFIPQQV